MSDIGTITEIEPEDGLGWIELANGDRVRFGGTACKGFVPAVGMAVEVLGTRPGYRGVVKATELRKAGAASAAAAARPSAPTTPPTTPQGGAEQATPVPRTALHALTASGVRSAELLSTLLGRSDVDQGFYEALVAAGLDLRPAAGAALGSRNPWFYAIAQDAAGAYGLYAHPMLAEYPGFPWVRWDREGDALGAVALDTASFLGGWLAGLEEGHRTALTPVFERLGVSPATPLQALEAEWLPPGGASLRPLDDYLGEADGVEMERGLLAHAWRRADARARASLLSLYETWEWAPPT